MAKTLIIIPTYNERDNVSPLLEEIFAKVPSVDVLFVDDNSQDGTADQIRDWQSKKPEQVFMLQRPGKMGLGSAYVAGFKYALSKDYLEIIEMDADFSHNPAYLPELIKTLASYDVAVGSRYVEGGGTENWGLIRKIISRFGSFYAWLILRTPLKDLTGGFNGWNRRVLEKLDLDSIQSEGYAFQIELKHRAHSEKFSIQEFPIIFEDRRVGHSKMSFRIVLEALYRVWLIR